MIDYMVGVENTEREKLSKDTKRLLKSLIADMKTEYIGKVDDPVSTLIETIEREKDYDLELAKSIKRQEIFTRVFKIFSTLLVVTLVIITALPLVKIEFTTRSSNLSIFMVGIFGLMGSLVYFLLSNFYAKDLLKQLENHFKARKQQKVA